MTKFDAFDSKTNGGSGTHTNTGSVVWECWGMSFEY